MKGIRIQAVSKELNNEKIDVIPWNAEPEIFIIRALSPAKPVRVLVDAPNQRAIAVAPDDQVSLAIGRGGQNRRLTSKLTGFEVEIIKESEYRKMVEEQSGNEAPLEVIEGLSETMVSKLHAAGLKTVQDVLDQGEDGLLQIKGIGEKTAKRIWALVQEREGAEEKAGAEKEAEEDDDEEEAEEQEATAELEEGEEEEKTAEEDETDEASPAKNAPTELADDEPDSSSERPAAPAEAAEVLETAESSEENQPQS
jgi:N utilization substance protein A